MATRIIYKGRYIPDDYPVVYENYVGNGMTQLTTGNDAPNLVTKAVVGTYSSLEEAAEEGRYLDLSQHSSCIPVGWRSGFVTADSSDCVSSSYSGKSRMAGICRIRK